MKSRKLSFIFVPLTSIFLVLASLPSQAYIKHALCIFSDKQGSVMRRKTCKLDTYNSGIFHLMMEGKTLKFCPVSIGYNGGTYRLCNSQKLWLSTRKRDNKGVEEFLQRSEQGDYGVDFWGLKIIW